MSESKKDSIRRIHPFSIGIMEHLAKIYVTGNRSNWFGTIRSQIGNIESISFKRRVTSSNYFSYLYIRPLHDHNLIWYRSRIGKSLGYNNHTVTEKEFTDFVDKLVLFYKWLAANLADPKWAVARHKDEVDRKLSELFLGFSIKL